MVSPGSAGLVTYKHDINDALLQVTPPVDQVKMDHYLYEPSSKSSDLFWSFLCFIGIMASFVCYGLSLEYTTSGGCNLHKLSFLSVTPGLYTYGHSGTLCAGALPFWTLPAWEAPLFHLLTSISIYLAAWSRGSKAIMRSISVEDTARFLEPEHCVVEVQVVSLQVSCLSRPETVFLARIKYIKIVESCIRLGWDRSPFSTHSSL